MSKPSYMNDFYSKKSQKEGIRARSYYKLEEIDHKFKIFTNLNEKDWVLDLGCCPGSWVQYCFKKTKGRIRVVGIDLKETQLFSEFPNKFHFIKENIEKISEKTLFSITGKRKYSVVMSDMAPNTTGNPERDAYISYELVLVSWDLAKKLLYGNYSDSTFIAKYFQGEESQELLNLLRKEAKKLHFENQLFKEGKVKLFKPNSSRKNSREIYIIIK